MLTETFTFITAWYHLSLHSHVRFVCFSGRLQLIGLDTDSYADADFDFDADVDREGTKDSGTSAHYS